MLLATPAAFGQSAELLIESSAGETLGAGETTTLTVKAMYDTSGSGGGVFGEQPGLFGFGGTVNASGDCVPESSSIGVNEMLTFGLTNGTATNGSAVRVGAGRGLDPALTENPATLFSFEVTMPDDASSGERVTFAYDGAVVLALGDELETFSTDPGSNQQDLVVFDLVLTIQTACNVADINGDGSNTFTDVLAFINLFDPADPSCTGPGSGPCNAADLDADGSNTFTDVLAFINSFDSAECP